MGRARKGKRGQRIAGANEIGGTHDHETKGTQSTGGEARDAKERSNCNAQRAKAGSERNSSAHITQELA